MMTALPSFVAALFGAGLVWAWLGQSFQVALLMSVLIAAVGLGGAVAYETGKRRICSDPIQGMVLMDLYHLVPITLGAFAAAIVIAVAVYLEPGEGASVVTKKISAALIGAFGALFATIVIKGLEDVDVNYVASRVQEAFEERFIGRFPAPARDAIYAWNWNGIAGWGVRARHERAKEVARLLAQFPKSATAPVAPGRC